MDDHLITLGTINSQSLMCQNKQGFSLSYQLGHRIWWLHLGKEIKLHPNECPGYDTKQSDSEVPVMLELWGMQSTSSLPYLLGPLWPGVVAPDRVLSMGQIELKCVLILHWITWNRTVLIFKLCTYDKLNCLK